MLTAGVGFGVVGLAADIAGAASLSKFGRDMEREADRIGFAQLLAQGYDPRSGVRLWDGMLKEEEARDYGKPVPAFASHPQTRERRDDLQAAADAVVAPGHELGRERFLDATTSFLRHWLDNELSRRMFATSIQAIGELRKTAPPEQAGLYAFYLGEAHRRRNKPGDSEQALALYAEAVRQAGAPAEAWREHGLALRDAGQRPAAATALQRYLQLAPQAEDRVFMQRYVDELGTSP
jgi:predicted Zn-dependent protease